LDETRRKTFYRARAVMFFRDFTDLQDLL
jgi:hypothetical protein